MQHVKLRRISQKGIQLRRLLKSLSRHNLWPAYKKACGRSGAEGLRLTVVPTVIIKMTSFVIESDGFYMLQSRGYLMTMGTPPLFS